MAVSSTNAATATSVLDVATLVSGLMQVENLPLTKLDTKIGAVTTKVTALGSFMSKASALGAALDKLADPTQYNARTATSSNSALVTVAATTGASAGTLAVQVKQTALAQQTLISGGFGSATAAVSAVAVNFNLSKRTTQAAADGSSAAAAAALSSRSQADAARATADTSTADAAAIALLDAAATAAEATASAAEAAAVTAAAASAAAAASNPPISIAVNAGMSLTDLATAITASDAGVSAAVVQQSDASWGLLLTSKAVGATQAFSTSFVDDTGAAAAMGTTTVTPQAATDAAIRVNGIDYQRASNTFTGVLPGVTLTLQQPVSAADWTTASTATIGVTTTNTNAADAVKAVVTAYNDAYSLYRSLTRTATDATLRGPLAADQTLDNFMDRVRAMVDSGVKDNAGHTVHFYDAGVTTSADGTLVVDSTKLQTALDGTLGTILANGANVGASTSATSLKTFVKESLLSGGLLANGQSSGQAQIKAYNDQKTTLSAKLVGVQARYTARYAKLDAQLTAMQQTSSALTSALAALPGSVKTN